MNEPVKPIRILLVGLETNPALRAKQLQHYVDAHHQGQFQVNAINAREFEKRRPRAETGHKVVDAHHVVLVDLVSGHSPLPRFLAYFTPKLWEHINYAPAPGIKLHEQRLKQYSVGEWESQLIEKIKNSE